mgnify:CR=1 FL=1
MALPQNAQMDALFESILNLKDVAECRKYLEDLCTVKELCAMAQRLEIARRLDRGESYLSTVEHTGASSATVSRVNRCLEYGAGGYRMMLQRLPELEAEA